MKAVFAIVAVATSLAAAADSPGVQIPDCAKPCLAQWVSGDTVAGCSAVDIKCVCENKDFISKIACCIEPKCNEDDKKTTLETAHKLCLSSGATIPTEIKCDTASGGSASNSKTDSSGSASKTSDVSTTSTKSSNTSKGSSSSPAATSTSNAVPVNGAGILGAAAALAFAL